jgi:single-strand DNA-binding protein
MAGVNKVILIGNLGKDPEVRNLEGGAKVASFTLATNEFFKGRDGNMVEQTEWHNVVLWRNRAELAEKYLRKGSQVYIEGRLRTRQWDDKDGNKRYMTEIVGDVINFLGARQSGGDSYVPPDNSPAPPDNDSNGGDDDLPF